METKEYLTQVENILNQMNEQQLKEWIYAQARIGKLQNRKAFISSLAGKEIKSSLNYDEIMEWCRKIDDEEIYFKAEEYEYYPEGGWESDYEVIYKDPFKIGNMIDNIFDLGFSMMMCKKYATPSWIRAPPESFNAITGAPFFRASVWTFTILAALVELSVPP